MRWISVSAALLLSVSVAHAQATKQLEKRAKDSQDAQRKSWQQVDQINNQTDQTNARLNQSRQNANQSLKGNGSTVTRSRVGVASPYRKPMVKKSAPKTKTSEQKTGSKDRK